MKQMFLYAISFNADLSKWDMRLPAAFNGINYMFYGATSFKQMLCSKAWVNLYEQAANMFKQSPGSISKTVCGVWIQNILLNV